jgi:hypothetical protein
MFHADTLRIKDDRRRPKDEADAPARRSSRGVPHDGLASACLRLSIVVQAIRAAAGRPSNKPRHFHVSREKARPRGGRGRARPRWLVEGASTPRTAHNAIPFEVFRTERPATRTKRALRRGQSRSTLLAKAGTEAITVDTCGIEHSSKSKNIGIRRLVWMLRCRLHDKREWHTAVPSRRYNSVQEALCF